MHLSFSADDDAPLLDAYQLVGEDGMALPAAESRRIMQAMMDYAGTALFMDEQDIKSFCSAKALDRGKKLIAAGQLLYRSCDGDSIRGTIEGQHPWFKFDMTEFGCDCSEPGSSNRGCSHVAALAWAWSIDQSTFMPAISSQREMKLFMDSPYGEVIQAITGEIEFIPALTAIKDMTAPVSASSGNALPPGPGPSAASARTAAGYSTGTAYWPLASSVRVGTPQLHETIEAEFNTAQLRELAKWLGIKLKGTAKSGYIEQVSAELNLRVARMRETPDVILEGLTEDHAAFVRRALTARDHELPLPRNLANALWTQQVHKDQDNRLTDLLEALRRRALLFPTRMYFGYRDVYYQWLPLGASGGNVPLTVWPAGVRAPKDPLQPPASSGTANFLDSFDLFINAALSTGIEVRASLPAHARAATTNWLKDWEHVTDEAERLLNSRPGWVPNPQSGIGVPLLSPLTSEAQSRLENQTGLPGPQCDFLFAIAAALQLVEAPDPIAASSKLKGVFRPLSEPWHVSARTSAIEEWFALPDEDKFLRAWTAWLEQLFFAVEPRHAAEATRKPTDKANFQIMRSIGARDFAPGDLSAEWCALRRYMVRVLHGLPATEWISWPEFRKALFEFYPDCAWAVFSQDNWWFSAPGKVTKLNPAHSEEWQSSVGAILEVILAESLKWFGIVDVEASAGDSRLQVFRITEMYDWLMRAQPAADSAVPGTVPKLPACGAPQPRRAEPIVWLDDRQWRLPPAPDRAEFTLFARKIADPADAPFTYVLTPASIERGLSQGVTVEEATRLFENFKAPLPESAQALYRSISERFGRVRVYESLTVLQLTDDYALRELLANTSLAQHVVYQLSPRAVVVRPEAVEGLVDEMVARGYTPGVK